MNPERSDLETTASTYDRREASELPRQADVVIIGAGIVGTASAFFLARAGVRPIVIEAGPTIAGRTTAMSAHCIRAQFSEPENVAMMAESLAFYERFADEVSLPGVNVDIDLRQQGYLFASTDPADAGAFSRRIDRQQSLGLDDVELLDGEAVRRRYPWLSDDVAVATFRRRDGWIDSSRAAQYLAAASGAPVYHDVAATRIIVEQDTVTGIETSAGPIATGAVVLAAGPFSRELSPDPLPVVLWRRHRLIIRPHSDIPQTGPVTIDANTGAHWRPHQGGALLAWAQAETDAPAAWSVEPDPAFVDLVLRHPDGVGRLAPFWRSLAGDLEARDMLLTAGQYTVTPDHKPLIGAAPETRGLWLHTGYSGHGIMGSPAGARLLADIIAGQLDVSANPFSPSRFEKGVSAPDVERIVL